MTKIDVDFDVVFCSFWGRLGAVLGSLLGLGLAFGRSKLAPRPSSKGLIFEEVILHEIMFYTTFETFSLPHGTPKRAKMVARRVLGRLGSFFSPLDFSL